MNRICTKLCSIGSLRARPHISACLLSVLGASASLLASPPASTPAAVHAPAPAPKAKHHWFQIGKASWYGRSFQGKRTANGEHFDMNALTCAHPTLPLGSWLRVTNLHNRRSIFVRVNDRGPYAAGTIIDLSYAAAQKVGLLGKTPVRVEAVQPDDPSLAHGLLAQLFPTDPTLTLAHATATP